MKPSPNHIVVLCPDEMRADALRCYGHPAAVTPNIDRLAASGARFERSYVTHTKCTPSRSSFLTGQYPHVGGHRTLDLPVRAGEVNLVRSLRDAGYVTALVGKNHCVDDETLPLTFDYHRRGDGGDRYLEPHENTGMPAGSYYVGRHPGELEDVGDHNSTTVALDWLSQTQAGDPDRPKFLWLNWDAPHPPYRAPVPFLGVTDRDQMPPLLPPAESWSNRLHRRLTDAYGIADMTVAQWREVRGCYLDMCAFVDHEVGRVMDHLKQLGIADETLVVLWSDHGDFAGDYQLPEKWDTAFPDCLVNVPLVMHAPDVIPAKVIDDFIETIDILPTVLDLVGVPVPGGVQGHSYRGVLCGGEPGPRDVVFCQGGQEWELLAKTVGAHDRPRPCEAYLMKQTALESDRTLNLRAKMIRGHRFKYVYRLDDREELYDIEKDPGELCNVASDPAYEDELSSQRLRMMRKLVEAESVFPAQDFLEA